MLGSPEAVVEAPPEAFEDFYVREYPAVVGLAYALSGSRWGAQESGPRSLPGGAPRLGANRLV